MPIKKTKPKASPIKDNLSDEETGRLALAYKGLQAEKKRVEAELKSMQENLKEVIAKRGETLPNNSVVFTTEYAGRSITLKLEARNSSSYAVDTMDVLKKKLPTDVYEKVVETTTFLREDVLEMLLNDGTIEMSVIEPLVEVTTSHAFKVDVK